MLRVLKGQVATLSLPRDSKPTSATVTITRDRDSASIVSAQACTVEADRVLYSLAAQSSVSNLTAVFTVVDAAGTSTVSVPVQVVGNRACSISDVRRLKPLDNVNRYPDELIERTITELEDQLEAACGVSFVPVERVAELHDGNGTTELFCRYARPQSVSAISVGGSALGQSTVDALVIDEEAGVIIGKSAWTSGRRNVSVTGVFGYSVVPGMVRQAVAEAVKYALVESRVDARATQVINEDGTSSTLVTAGLRQNLFSLPALNAVVMQYRTGFGVA